MTKVNPFMCTVQQQDISMLRNCHLCLLPFPWAEFSFLYYISSIRRKSVVLLQLFCISFVMYFSLGRVDSNKVTRGHWDCVTLDFSGLQILTEIREVAVGFTKCGCYFLFWWCWDFFFKFDLFIWKVIERENFHTDLLSRWPLWLGLG